MEKDEKYCQDCKREQCPLHCPGLVSNKPVQSPQAARDTGSAGGRGSVANLDDLTELAAAWLKASELLDRQGDSKGSQATMTCAEQLMNVLGV